MINLSMVEEVRNMKQSFRKERLVCLETGVILSRDNRHVVKASCEVIAVPITCCFKIMEFTRFPFTGKVNPNTLDYHSLDVYVAIYM